MIASLQRELNALRAENEDWEKKAADTRNKINALEKEEDELMDTNTDTLIISICTLQLADKAKRSLLSTNGCNINKLKQFVSEMLPLESQFTVPPVTADIVKANNTTRLS